MQRDDAAKDPPKLREESPFYAENLAKAQARAVELTQMSLSDAQAAATEEYDRLCREHAEYEGARTETRNRYNAMLSAVIAWQPPTPDHQGLKDLMVQQLTDSRQFDCDYSSAYPVPRSAEKYLAEEREKARLGCDLAAQSLGEEKERVAKANAWITALYESLPADSTPTRQDSQRHQPGCMALQAWDEPDACTCASPAVAQAVEMPHDVRRLINRAKDIIGTRGKPLDSYESVVVYLADRVAHLEQLRDDVFLLAHRIRRNQSLDLVPHIIRLCEERGAKAQILRSDPSPSRPAGDTIHG